MTDQTMLGAAHAIGRRLVANALWSGDECTWLIMGRDESAPHSRQPRAQVANGCLYQGTAGIALFLAEAGSRTGDPQLRNAALGAIRHALRAATQAPRSRDASLHEGRIGIAWAATLIGARWVDESLLHDAGELLNPLAPEIFSDTLYDVIGGAAGAIPALLAIAHLRSDTTLRDAALEMGERLVRASVRSTDGWSWGNSWAVQNTRNLTGLAHGASGCGLALLELSAITGDGRFLYAADRAFDYERGAFLTAEENWPDFRHPMLMEYVFDYGLPALRDALKAGVRVDPYTSRCMNAWCHGAPGIGLSRCRAHLLAPDDAITEECAAAIRTTLQAVRHPHYDFSLCHGVAGNTELLRVAARQFGNQEAGDVATAAMLEGIDRFERRGIPWPCGTYGQASDPSLMLGEAGIGYALLRATSDDVPSVLLIDTMSAKPAPARWSDAYTSSFHDELAWHAARSLQSFAARTGSDGVAVLAEAQARTRRLDFEKLRALADQFTSPVDRSAVEAALCVDRVVDEAQRAYDQHTTWSLDLLLLDREMAIEGDSRLRCPADVQVVWPGGTPGRNNGPHAVPAQHDDNAVLLVFRNRRIVQRNLSAFQAWLLFRLQAPHTIRELADALSQELGGTASAAELMNLVRRQVELACREGLIIADETRTPVDGNLYGAAPFLNVEVQPGGGQHEEDQAQHR